MSEGIMARLRRARKAKRIRQREIAAALDVTVPQVSRLERGRRAATVDQLCVWAALVGLRVVLESVEGEG